LVQLFKTFLKKIEGWRIRKNKELEELFQKPNILNIIQSRRLQWAGHAWRSQNPLLHMVLAENIEGKRPLGRGPVAKGGKGGISPLKNIRKMFILQQRKTGLTVAIPINIIHSD